MTDRCCRVCAQVSGAAGDLRAGAGHVRRAVSRPARSGARTHRRAGRYRWTRLDALPTMRLADAAPGQGRSRLAGASRTWRCSSQCVPKPMPSMAICRYARSAAATDSRVVFPDAAHTRSPSIPSPRCCHGYLRPDASKAFPDWSSIRPLSDSRSSPRPPPRHRRSGTRSANFLTLARSIARVGLPSTDAADSWDGACPGLLPPHPGRTKSVRFSQHGLYSAFARRATRTTPAALCVRTPLPCVMHHITRARRFDTNQRFDPSPAFCGPCGSTFLGRSTPELRRRS